MWAFLCHFIHSVTLPIKKTIQSKANWAESQAPLSDDFDLSCNLSNSSFTAHNIETSIFGSYLDKDNSSAIVESNDSMGNIKPLFTGDYNSGFINNNSSKYSNLFNKELQSDTYFKDSVQQTK